MEKLIKRALGLSIPKRIYFTKQAERKVFFILTLLMLGYGVLAKIGFY